MLPVAPAPSDAAPPVRAAPSPRVRVRNALRDLAIGGEWPFPNWIVLQNRVLDEVGSDLRPLVALLVRAGEAGVLEQMPGSRATWPAARGALVLSLTAHSFLQPEMARWAVECWGYALGIVAESDLTVAADPWVAVALPARADDGVPTQTPPAASPAAGAAPLGGATLGAVAPRSPVPVAVAAPHAARRMPTAGPAAGPAPARGSSAPSPVGRPTAVPSSSASARSRRPGILPEGLNNPIAGTSLAGLVAFAGYVLVSAMRLPNARATAGSRTSSAEPGWEAERGAVPRATPGPALPAPAAPGIPGITTNGLPQTPDDSARMVAVVPARRPTDALERVPRADVGPPASDAAVDAAVPVPPLAGTLGQSPPAAGPAALVRRSLTPVPLAVPTTTPSAPTIPDGFDRLRLRDGRMVRGRVELVRVSAVVFRDADTGLRYEYPKTEIDAVVTEFGSTVRFSPPEPTGAPNASGAARASAAERAAAFLVRRGVGGRYEVHFTVASINGSPECQRGWRTPPRTDWARVAHVPGADTLSITFEGGATFASVIDPQAQFASTFVIVPDQAYSGSALTTRLSGQFTPGGFDAAVNLVGYRRVREGRDVACHTVLRAVGRWQAR